MRKNTACVHAGTIKCKDFPGVTSPIYTSSAWGFIDPEDKPYYPRYFNVPNHDAAAEKLCALENGEQGLVFGSGMAAITTTLLTFLEQGNHAIFQNGLYGGTIHHITTDLPKFGIDYSFVDARNTEAIEEAIRPETKILYIETPSNPLLTITDIEAVAAIAGKHKLLTLIDNTFATPINQNPMDLGMDMVLHSGTKFLGGHNDMSAGAVVSRKELIEKIHESALTLGGSLDANACYLLERSLKTLSLRVQRQNENAMKIAAFLSEHEKVDNVYYPGLETHPGHEIAKRQMKGFGGMLSFELKGDRRDVRNFLISLKLIGPAMSLGGVETIVCVPADTSHVYLSPEEREVLGIKDQLIRVSVGIEDADDLIADLEKAF